MRLDHITPKAFGRETENVTKAAMQKDKITGKYLLIKLQKTLRYAHQIQIDL